MGREERSWDIKVYWTVSRHNSRDDDIDDLLEDQLREELQKKQDEIEQILKEPDYVRLNAFIV